MKIDVNNLSFGYGGASLFNALSLTFDSGESALPIMVLGPSGSGKTTLLKLLAGLLKPEAGEINFISEKDAYQANASGQLFGKAETSFIFQEPRLLPWLTVLENVSLPLYKIMGKEEGRKRADHFLSQVFLDDKANAYPAQLSGGEAQRVSMSRAFAWPSPVLFMDEPFQSLDIPLRLSLMDLTLSLLEKEKRLLVAVTHDPREAVYMGGRIIILGGEGKGIVFDKIVGLSPEDRVYGSVAAGELERELIALLRP